MRVRHVRPIATDGSRYASLTVGREYEVLGIEADWLRLLNDRGEPVLFDPNCFEVVEAGEPRDWVSHFEEGVRYSYPPMWGEPGYFEDWHDGDPGARQRFEEEFERRYGRPPASA